MKFKNKHLQSATVMKEVNEMSLHNNAHKYTNPSPKIIHKALKGQNKFHRNQIHNQ